MEYLGEYTILIPFDGLTFCQNDLETDLESITITLPKTPTATNKTPSLSVTASVARTVINGHEIMCFGANDQWIAASDPLHYDKPQAVGVGPGLSFAKLIAELDIVDSNRKIGLIPCAVGGSSIREWLPKHIHIEHDAVIEMDRETKESGYDSGETADGHFETAIARTRLSMHTPFEPISKRLHSLHSPEDLDGNGMNGIHGVCDGLDIELKAILWHQGESDCDSQQNANLYIECATMLFEHFRTELGEDNIPIIVGGLGDFLGQNASNRFMFYNVINTALMSLPQRLHNVGYVSSAGLTHKGDFLHFDSESARILGHRFGEKYGKLSGMLTQEELTRFVRFAKFKNALSKTGKKALQKTRGISWSAWLVGTVVIVGTVYGAMYAYKLHLDRKQPVNDRGNIDRQ